MRPPRGLSRFLVQPCDDLCNDIAAMCLHNAMQFCIKKDWRNAVNALVYAGAVVFEAHHTYEHWSGDA